MRQYSNSKIHSHCSIRMKIFSDFINYLSGHEHTWISMLGSVSLELESRFCHFIAPLSNKRIARTLSLGWWMWPAKLIANKIVQMNVIYEQFLCKQRPMWTIFHHIETEIVRYIHTDLWEAIRQKVAFITCTRYAICLIIRNDTWKA